MCGRFYFTAGVDEVRRGFPQLVLPAELPARYNVAPGQRVAVITNTEPATLQFFRWGLVPSWAKDTVIGSRMINARSETIAEKPAFRAALKARRCLILANGFFEWALPPQAHTPYRISLRDGALFVLAGLWEVWHPGDGDPLHTCTIITTAANDLMAPFHHRMPVILPPDDNAAWLAPNPQPAEHLTALLRQYPAEAMLAVPVSSLVNNARVNLPEVLEPQGENAGTQTLPLPM